MDDLAVSGAFIEGLAQSVSAAGRAAHLSGAATTDGVDGLESAVAESALNESNAERVQRAKLSAEAITELASSTAAVAFQMQDVDRKLANSMDAR